MRGGSGGVCLLWTKRVRVGERVWEREEEINAYIEREGGKGGGIPFFFFLRGRELGMGQR